MIFCIQAAQPRLTYQYDSEDETIGEAIETVFPLLTESAILVWKNVYIPLNYKYDLSVMCEDILKMISRLTNEKEGELRIDWPSNTFSAIWNLLWTADSLEIRSRWQSVVGGTEGLLAQQEVITITKSEFIAEWKQPLKNIRFALKESGYTVKNLPGFLRLKRIVEGIDREGILYSG